MKFITHNTIAKNTVDAFLGSSDPESCCTDRSFHEDVTLVLELFVVMSYKKCCDVAAALNDKRELFAYTAAWLSLLSILRKTLFINTGVQFPRGLSFESSFPTDKRVNSWLSLSLHTSDYESFCF